MKRQTLATIIGATALGLAGCATTSQRETTTSSTWLQGYLERATTSQRGTTNTLPISAGREEYAFNPGQIDFLNVGSEEYALTPKDPTTRVMINNSHGEKQAAKNVLEARLVPYSNSTIDRVADDIKITPNGSFSYLVNCYYDTNKVLQRNFEDEPRGSFFVVNKRTFPETITTDELNQVKSHVFEKVIKRPGQVEFNGQKYIPITDRDIEGKKSKVFIDASTITPRYSAKMIKLENGSIMIDARFGFQGVGYYPMEGNEVIIPSQEDLEEEGYQRIEVIEGGPSMYLSVPEQFRSKSNSDKIILQGIHLE